MVIYSGVREYVHTHNTHTYLHTQTHIYTRRLFPELYDNIIIRLPIPISKVVC